MTYLLKCGLGLDVFAAIYMASRLRPRVVRFGAGWLATQQDHRGES